MQLFNVLKKALFVEQKLCFIAIKHIKECEEMTILPENCLVKKLNTRLTNMITFREELRKSEDEKKKNKVKTYHRKKLLEDIVSINQDYLRVLDQKARNKTTEGCMEEWTKLFKTELK